MFTRKKSNCRIFHLTPIHGKASRNWHEMITFACSTFLDLAPHTPSCVGQCARRSEHNCNHSRYKIQANLHILSLTLLNTNLTSSSYLYSKIFRIVLVSPSIHLRFKAKTKRSSIEDKAKFYRRQSEDLSKTKRRSIEDLSKTYRRSIEDLSKRGVISHCYRYNI